MHRGWIYKEAGPALGKKRGWQSLGFSCCGADPGLAALGRGLFTAADIITQRDSPML